MRVLIPIALSNKPACTKGYEVAEVFRDGAVTGQSIDWPGLLAMVAYLKKNKHTEYVVLIDDISRLARGVMAHHTVRDAITNAGTRLASLSIEFGDGSDFNLIENLLAAVAQHQREKNVEQTRNQMRACRTAIGLCLGSFRVALT